MAETYDIVIAIKVIKADTQEPLVDEEIFFNHQGFGRMVNLADEFYELTAKLQKIK